jgi:NTP pyrophosphatase (non-canonical NTP hydrolase)
MKEIFYLYHIPGKKIGITRNLKDRVTRQQGYTADEYEVLLTSDDIDYISDKEIELQKSYGYKRDIKLYKNLFNKMKINVTEQTTTFPLPINKLKGRLMDNIGLKWKHSEFGTFEITKENIQWIMQNVKTSMFNSDRSYIYNKAFYEACFNKTKNVYKDNEVNVYDLIRQWATDKGIYKSGDSRTQYVKLMEEAGELAQAILKNDEPEVIDAIGDMVVVLTNLAKLRGHNIEDCVTSAYDVIKSRTGKMVNGSFVKSESL